MQKSLGGGLMVAILRKRKVNGLDCGPGRMMKDAITFTRACEPMHITWIEDILTGDHTPCPNAELFRDLKQATSVLIHTGEQVYLRQNFKDLKDHQFFDRGNARCYRLCRAAI